MSRAAGAEPSPLDLTTLRVVIAVAEAGSMSAGSEHTGLALGAVSARISALEQSLGVSVFERGPRGVRLTPAGQRLVQRGQQLLAESDRLVRDLHEHGAGLQGQVRLLANASSLIEFLPDRLMRFARSHPRVRVDVEERSSPEIPLEVLEGRADLGVVDLPHPVQGLRFHDLFRDELALIVPRSHALASRRRVALEDVITQEFICLPDGNAISGRLVAAAAQNGQRLAVRMRMRSFDAVCRMVAAGLGLSVLPLESIAPQLAALPLAAVSLRDGWARRVHRLALREELPERHVARTLADALRRSRG